MLVNLVPELLAILAAPDPPAAYHEYLERHKPVLQSYWHNYVLDPTSPHAERVVAAALRPSAPIWSGYSRTWMSPRSRRMRCTAHSSSSRRTAQWTCT